MDNNQTINIWRDLFKDITKLYLFLIIGVFPLVFNNYYLDITYTKKVFFQRVTLVYIVCFVLLALPMIFTLKSKEKNIVNIKRPRVSVSDLFGVMFVLAILVSCLLSCYRLEAFVGQTGRLLGGFYLAICVLVYFLISRYYTASMLLPYIFIATNFTMFAVAVLQFFGVDVFGFYKHLIKAQHTGFQTTLGNIDIATTYYGIVTLVIIVFCYFETNAIKKKVYYVMSAFGVYSCFSLRCSSFIAMIGVGLLALFFVSLRSKEEIKKWIYVSSSYVIGALFMCLTVHEDRLFGWELIRVADLKKEKIVYPFVSVWVIAVEVIALVFLYIIVSKFYSDKRVLTIKIIFGIALLAALIIGLYEVLPLKDSFGNNRGYIWKVASRTFKEAPISRKLFGYGPNCFYNVIEPKYGREMVERFYNPFIDAHNELLQFLVTTGLFGVISYFGFIIASLVYFIRGNKKEINRACTAGIVLVIAYLAQGIVCNPVVINIPIVFIGIGLFMAQDREQHIFKEKNKKKVDSREL